MSENNKKTKELSMLSPKVEFKALVTNTPKNIIPESLVGDRKQPILDTSRGTDSPKKIPKDQD